MDQPPLVLFGAFDRHNLGDWLLGHVAQRLAGARPCLFAGLRAADLRGDCGFLVRALPDLVAEWPRRWGDAPMELWHVGGEILDTDAWEAAVMLLPPAEAVARVAALDGQPKQARAWARDYLGAARQAPYVVSPGDLPPGSRVRFAAVGGVGLAVRPPAYRAEVLAALGAGGHLAVRDHVTLTGLARLGRAATLVPDPVAAHAALLAGDIARAPHPAGEYLAVQFAATLADDATLAALATCLNGLGLPVVLWCAGTAPWHDDPAACGRLAERLRGPVTVEESRDIWCLSSLLSHARGCLASSLHALLLAGSAGVPAWGLERRDGEGTKLRAYADTWGGFSVSTAARLAVDCLHSKPYKR